MAKALEAWRAAAPGKRRHQEAVPGREFGLLERYPNREGLQRQPLGTYKQIQEFGGQVRKGEKATPVLFYKFDDERTAQQPAGAPDTEKTGKTPDGGHERTRPPMVRCYHVFNAEQADGLTLERRADEPQPEWQSHQAAELVIRESGVAVTHARGDRAFYNLQTDRVTLPEQDQFASANGCYQTAMYELGHATGHPNRLDRATLKNGVRDFGSVEYAREELRAEISAMLTGARVGVGHDGSRGATYVKGWLTALEHDPQEIDKAAAEAQHMSDYLLRQIRGHEQAIAQKYAELADTYSAVRSPQISPAPTARPRDTRPPLPVGAASGPQADDHQPEGDPPPRCARRSGAGDRVTSPVTRPPVQDRASQLAALAALG